MELDLSGLNVKKHIDVFNGLAHKPSFSVSIDADVQILFFKRKDKYVDLRTGDKADFESCSQFIIYSYLVEKIQARTKEQLVLEDLTVVDCPLDELHNIFSRAESINEQLPHIGDVKRAQTIVNGSDLHWILLEDKSKYHSMFWNETESTLFSRCA